MRASDTTVKELEAFWKSLQGPLGRALRDAGSIMNQRLEARGQELGELTDPELLDLLLGALRVAAPAHYQHVDRATLDAGLDDLVAAVRMEMAANAGSSETVN